MKFFNIKVALFALAAIISAQSAGALNLSLTDAGTIKEAIGNDTTTTALTVNGPINLADLEYISFHMRSLESLDLSNTTVEAYSGEATFLGRTSAKANELPECSLMSLPARSVSLPSTLTEIADGALGGSSITELTIPASVTTIGNSAFAECKNLKSINIPASVNSLGTSAFKGCTSLKSATISAAGVSILPDNIFQGCIALETVTLPSSLQTIGNAAFAGCTSLKEIDLPSALKSIGTSAFSHAGLVSIDMSACRNLTDLGAWSFANCPALASVTLSSATTALPDGVFYLLGTPEFNGYGHVETIGDYALAGTEAPEIISGSKVESIGKYGVAEWRNVKSLVFPETMIHLDDHAMANWTELISLDATKVPIVPTLGNDVWDGVDKPMVDVTVPSNLFDEFEAAPQWQDFHLTSVPTSEDKIDLPTSGSGLSARFDGMTLILESPVEISAAYIYDVSGRRFTLPGSRQTGNIMTIDTSSWNTPVMIVRVLLADGTSAALKLSR